MSAKLTQQQANVIIINPNRSLEKNFLLFLMTAIRKSVLYMFDT